MKLYRIVNDNDANDTFTVEADSTEEAAFAALNVLGWFVAERDEEDEDSDATS